MKIPQTWNNGALERWSVGLKFPILHSPSLQLYFSLEEYSSIFLPFFRVGGDIEFVHLYGLNVLGVGYGRVDSFTRDELAVLGHDFETVVAEKVIDQGLPRIRMKRPAAERDGVAVA